jgi:hypothetical protein
LHGYENLEHDGEWIASLVSSVAQLAEFSLIVDHSSGLGVSTVLEALQVKPPLQRVKLQFQQLSSRSTSIYLRHFIRENASRLTPLAMTLVVPTGQAETDEDIAVAVIQLGQTQAQASTDSSIGDSEKSSPADVDLAVSCPLLASTCRVCAI